MFNSEIYNVLTCNSTVAEIVKIIKTRKLTKVKFVDNQIMNQLSYEVEISLKQILFSKEILKIKFIKLWTNFHLSIMNMKDDILLLITFYERKIFW